MRTLTPIVYSAGGSIGGLGVFGGAARAGLAGLAAVITASVIVSLERASDTLNVLKGRLADIHGDGAAKELAKSRCWRRRRQTPIASAARNLRLVAEQTKSTANFA